MTTDARILHTNDVFTPNDVYALERAHYPEITSLAAVAWLFVLSPRTAHVHGYIAALASVLRAAPSLRPWLLVGQTVMQENTPLIMHRKLWRTFSRDTSTLPMNLATEEFVVQYEDGVRWFGGVPIRDTVHIESAAKLIETEHASAMVMIDQPTEQKLPDLLRNGWSYDSRRPHVEMLTWVVDHAGLMLWPVGAFDDRESGVVAFGDRDVVAQVLRSK